MINKPKARLRVAALLLTIASVPACAKLNEDQAVEKVVKTIKKHKFLKVPGECVRVMTSKETPRCFSFDIREWHSGPNCPGDPDVAPRLFSFVIDRKSSAMKTDAANPEGEMVPVK